MMPLLTPPKILALAICVLSAGAVLAAPSTPPTQPVAPKEPFTDTYFGTPVIDNYRWMEKLDDPKVESYMKAQAQFARAKLDAIPGRAALLERIHELGDATTRREGFVRRGNRYFYQVKEPGAAVPKLYYRDGLKGDEHLLIDPAALAVGTQTHYALDFFSPSWDGKTVAYGVSAGGSEESVLHLLDVETGKPLAESIDRTSDSLVSWLPDNKSFYYMRFRPLTPDLAPDQRSYNAHSFFHVIGTHTDGTGDQVVFGHKVSAKLDVPEGQGAYVVLAQDSPYAVAVANHNMDDNPNTLFVAKTSQIKDATTPWRKLASVDDSVVQFELAGDTLYFLSHKNASHGTILATPLAHPDVNHARVVLAQSDKILVGFSLSRDGLYVVARDGAVMELSLLSFDGRDNKQIALPFQGTVRDTATDPRAPGILFSNEGWIHSAEAFTYDPSMAQAGDSGMQPPSPIDVSKVETKEVMVTSYDGTRVPLSLIYEKGLALDGSHPVMLEGYGSYGFANDPQFSTAALAWVEHGGVLAEAHIRGGGELGEDWHTGGQKLTKLNTVFDFIACGQYLVDQHYTSPQHLAGIGESAGGVTAGGALAWRPDLFAVILDLVGMSDTLRAETGPNGPPNIIEFGTTKEEAGFHGLYAMSAYDHIRDGVAYPAVMFHTGAHDPRVDPWEMLKMTARVQAATSSGKPVLLSVDYDAGHGIGSSQAQREALLADLWSFALWQMGDPAFQPPK